MFISLVESSSTVIRKTSPEHFQARFFRNPLKICKIVRRKLFLNFLLVYISLTLKFFRRKLKKLQTTESELGLLAVFLFLNNLKHCFFP